MAYAVVNKSGCAVRKGNIQLRLDFFLDEGEPRYDDCHGGPFHSHFIYLPPTFTQEDIEAAIELHLPNFYKAFQEGADKDAGGMRRGWLTETRITPTDYSKTEGATNYASRVQQCQAALNKLTAFSYKPTGDGEGKLSPATAIDIGPGATDRSAATYGANTWLDLANPANDTGTIDTFEVWAYETMSLTNKVGTFHGSGTSWTNRDGETIGTITAGAKRTFTGLSIAVSTNDIAGIYWPTDGGRVEADGTGGAGGRYKSGDQFGTGAQTYTVVNGRATSIYGTGATPSVTRGASASMAATLIGAGGL